MLRTPFIAAGQSEYFLDADQSLSALTARCAKGRHNCIEKWQRNTCTGAAKKRPPGNFLFGDEMHVITSSKNWGVRLTADYFACGLAGCQRVLHAERITHDDAHDQ